MNCFSHFSTFLQMKFGPQTKWKYLKACHHVALTMLNFIVKLQSIFLSFLWLLTCCRADFYQSVNDQTIPENELLRNGTKVISSISPIQCALRCSRLNTICQTFLYDSENRKCILQTGILQQKTKGYGTWNRLQKPKG